MREPGRSNPTRVAVLIPCLNEDATIADVVKDFRAALPSAEVYVCDNGSTDRSASEATAAGATVLHEPRRGKGYAVRSMFQSVDADIYLLVDGDRTYPADAAASLLAPILNDRADMVVGSRLHPRASSEFDPLRKLGNVVFLGALRLLFRIELTDLLSGYRALTRTLVRQLSLTSDGFQIEAELTITVIGAGFRVVEVPVDLRPRPKGSVSKLRPSRDGLAILKTMFSLRRRRR